MDSVPPPGEVQFGDLRRVTPLARRFGYDRGTPIDRHYIESFLAECRNDIRGRVLEIGGDSYTRQFGTNQLDRIDILHVSADNPHATIVADLSNAPQIPSDTFDCIICTQTLQLIYDVRSAVTTLHRILKPGGVVLATFPGISQIDDEGWSSSWYWNLTPVSATRLFNDQFLGGRVDVRSHGNILTAICFMHGLALSEVTPEQLAFTDPAFPFLITVRATRPK